MMGCVQGMPVGTLAGDTMSADMRARNENLLSRANSILQELQTIQSAQVRIVSYRIVWALGISPDGLDRY
jgi:hypothetical protein